MNKEIRVLKDEEEQQPIPSVWRKSLFDIVEAFKDGDFQLGRGIAGVRQLSLKDAEIIGRTFQEYGAHLTNLPEDTWKTSVCQWMRGYWDALIDLYTLEEGASDLALSVRVYEVEKGYDFWVQSVHVP